MNCEDCERAERKPATGRFNANCLDCTARALAQSPAAKARESDPDTLRAVMRKAWPDEAEYRKGRLAVWLWMKRLEESCAETR